MLTNQSRRTCETQSKNFNSEKSIEKKPKESTKIQKRV